MSVNESIKERFSVLSDELLAKQNEIQKEIQKEIPVAFDALFDAYPKLVWFSWTQYTPYFNDGDACTFRVYDISWIQFEGMEDFMDPYEYHTFSYDSKRNKLPELSDGDKKSNEVKFPWVSLETFNWLMEELNLVQQIPTEALNSIYGEWEIVVTRGNIEVQDYDHD